MSEHSKMNHLLSPFRVLDLTDKIRLFLLQDPGRPGCRGHPGGEVGNQAGLLVVGLQLGKKLVQLDIEREPKKVLGLAWEVDFFIESFPQDTSTWGWDTRP